MSLTPTLLYFNVSGFGVVYTLTGRTSILGDFLDIIAEEWKYIIIARRVVSYPMVLKTLIDHCKQGVCFSRIYFYEIRHKPISMLYKILDAKTILLIDSSPEPNSLLRRVIANPRYSNSIVLLAQTKIVRPDLPLEWIQRMTKTARRLYLELSPIIYGREMGRLVALQLQEQAEGISVNICVSREGVSSIFQHGGIRVEIRGIDQCLT